MISSLNLSAICFKVRRWLDKVKKRRQDPPFYSRPPGLTAERREILLDQIRSHLDSQPVRIKSKLFIFYF